MSILEPPSLIRTRWDYFCPGLGLISRGKTDLYYEDALDHAIASDSRVRAMLIGGVPWTEVDTPEDLEYARTIYQRFWE